MSIFWPNYQPYTLCAPAVNCRRFAPFAHDGGPDKACIEEIIVVLAVDVFRAIFVDDYIAVPNGALLHHHYFGGSANGEMAWSVRDGSHAGAAYANSNALC